MNEPRRQTFRAWVPIALMAILLFYPLSFGPACWMASRPGPNRDYESKMRLLNGIYAPVYWTHHYSPPVVQEQIENFANLGVENGAIDFYFDRICFFEDAAPGADFAFVY
ncbi:MAG: hypothetical protein JWN70_2563 [Planctomycetaceae bacterium]|nr:hypothetical protein [Planctomycetaceae bacterium]